MNANGKIRSLRSGMEKDVMVPKVLKMLTFKIGNKHVTRKMNKRNFPCSSGLIGSNDVGSAHERSKKKYVGINNG